MKYQKDSLSQFSEQINDRLNGYKPHGIKISEVRNVVICGLGGSGIGGKIVKSYFEDISPIPIVLNSKYDLPHFVDSSTLVVLSSYSGNTEETLAMLASAKEKGAKIIGLTSGGKINEDLPSLSPVYSAKPGFQPRMALGYSLTNLFLVLGELFSVDLFPELRIAVNNLSNQSRYYDLGMELFKELRGFDYQRFVIISDDKFESISTRFAQQIQENAKLEAFVNVLPEANHNVIETYHSKLPGVFCLLDSKSNKRTSQRFDFVKDLLLKNGNSVVEISVMGIGLSQWLETIYVLDWTSLWLADSLDRESENVPIITALKEYLAAH
ncbi:MAG: glucose/mannose-6-phosphate isomerase [Sphingobacteriales bacterium]|jgi:glucose/mannose-6-phosphate isomerase